MVRYYKRISNTSYHDRKKIFEAVKQVKIHKKSIRKAAREVGIIFTALQYHLNKYKDVDVKADTEILFEPMSKQVFSPELEKKLVEKMLDCSTAKNGLTSIEMREIAYNCALNFNLSVPKNWVSQKMAGRDWLILFKKRHPFLSKNNIPIRKFNSNPENDISSNLEVKTYFDNLEQILSTYDFKAEDIFNMSEVGITASNKPNRVVNKKRVKSNSSFEQDKLVTVVSTISAAGSSLPPFFIFPKNNDCDNRVLQGVSEENKNQLQPSEWMNNDFFLNYLQHFVSNTECSIKKPRLLILVQHINYKLSSVKNYAKANGVMLLLMPAKYLHKLHPLDVHLLTSFRNEINKNAAEWVITNKNESMKVSDIPDLVSAVYAKVFTKMKIQAGFQLSGIYPLDRSILGRVSPLENFNELDIETDNNIYTSHNHSNQLDLISPVSHVYQLEDKILQKNQPCILTSNDNKLRKDKTEENLNIHSKSDFIVLPKENKSVEKTKKTISKRNYIKRKSSLNTKAKEKKNSKKKSMFSETLPACNQMEGVFTDKVCTDKEPKKDSSDNLTLTKQQINMQGVSRKRKAVLCSTKLLINKNNLKDKQLQNEQVNNIVLRSTKNKLFQKISKKTKNEQIDIQQYSFTSENLENVLSVLNSHNLNIPDLGITQDKEKNKQEILESKIWLSEENENFKNTQEFSHDSALDKIVNKEMIFDQFEIGQLNIDDLDLTWNQTLEVGAGSFFNSLSSTPNEVLEKKLEHDIPDLHQPQNIQNCTKEILEDNQYKFSKCSSNSQRAKNVLNTVPKDPQNTLKQTNTTKETLKKKVNTNKKIRNTQKKDPLADKKIIIKEIIQSILSKKK